MEHEARGATPLLPTRQYIGTSATMSDSCASYVRPLVLQLTRPLRPPVPLVVDENRAVEEPTLRQGLVLVLFRQPFQFRP